MHIVASLQETRTEANGGAEDYSVVRRQEGRYILEPLKPDLKKGYVIVTEEERVFCGLCPGFTCSHEQFMHNWLRTHWSNSERAMAILVIPNSLLFQATVTVALFGAFLTSWSQRASHIRMASRTAHRSQVGEFREYDLRQSYG